MKKIVMTLLTLTVLHANAGGPPVEAIPSSYSFSELKFNYWNAGAVSKEVLKGTWKLIARAASDSRKISSVLVSLYLKKPGGLMSSI